MLAEDVMMQVSQEEPSQLAGVLEGVSQAAIKLRAVAPSGDTEEGAEVICEMLQRLREDLEQLRALNDPVGEMVLAEQMAMLAEDLASAASLLRESSAMPSARAASEVAFHSARFARSLSSDPRRRSP